MSRCGAICGSVPYSHCILTWHANRRLILLLACPSVTPFDIQDKEEQKKRMWRKRKQKETKENESMKKVKKTTTTKESEDAEEEPQEDLHSPRWHLWPSGTQPRHVGILLRVAFPANPPKDAIRTDPKQGRASCISSPQWHGARRQERGKRHKFRPISPPPFSLGLPDALPRTLLLLLRPSSLPGAWSSFPPPLQDAYLTFRHVEGCGSTCERD